MPVMDMTEYASENARMIEALLHEQSRLADELERLARDGISISRTVDMELRERAEALVASTWAAVRAVEARGSHV